MASQITSSSSSIPSSRYIDRFNSSNLDHSFSFRGLQELHLDLIAEGNRHTWFGGSSSGKKELIWGRTWTEESPQIALLNRFRSCTAQNADKAMGTCLFDKLKTVQLDCKDSISGAYPLRALSEDGIPLRECTLELTNSDRNGPKAHTFTLHDIFVGNNRAFSPSIRNQLYNIINFLRRGVLSHKEAALDLENGDFDNLKSQLTFDGMQSSELGGTFWGTLRADISTSNPKLLGLATPGKAITFVAGSYEGRSYCSLEEEGSSGKYQTTCLHDLYDNKGLQPTEKVRLSHTEGGSTTIVGSPTHVDNWYKALRKEGLIAPGLSSSTSNSDYNQEEIRVAHSYFSASSSSSSFKAPTKSNLLHSLLVPIGLSMTAAGLFYAKSNYENTRKSDLRRVVGGVVGIAGAILGVGIASLPFSSI